MIIIVCPEENTIIWGLLYAEDHYDRHVVWGCIMSWWSWYYLHVNIGEVDVNELWYAKRYRSIEGNRVREIIMIDGLCEDALYRGGRDIICVWILVKLIVVNFDLLNFNDAFVWRESRWIGWCDDW